MIDENAFGILLAHYDLESLEYSLGEDAFLEHLGRFNNLVDTKLAATPLASSMRRVDMGHAVYLEFADGEQETDPLAWIRAMRLLLVEADIPNVCVLAAGGRWVEASEEECPSDSDVSLPSVESMPQARESGAWRVSTAKEPDASNPLASPCPIHNERVEATSPGTFGPSEPLRKALAAESFAQPTTSGATDHGWGPGLYVEKDAIEQLGKNLKNAPTALAVHSSTFYRIGG